MQAVEGLFEMRWRKLSTKQILLLALPVLFMLVPFASAHTITVPTHAYFGLPSYSTYINFNSQQTFDTVYRESSYWYFDGYGFQVQNANMTITNFFVGDKLVFTVSAPSETTSTTKVYCGSKGEPTTVTGASSYTYNSGSKILTVTVTHSSSQQVTLDWSAKAPPADEEETTGMKVKYSLTVTVVDEDGIVVEDAFVTVWRDTTSVASKLTNEDGVAKFALAKGSYLITAEGSPRVGTASIVLDKNVDVTVTLLEPSPPLDIFEGIKETIVAQNWTTLLFMIVGFAFLPVGGVVGWYGVSEEENWVKIVAGLIILLGIVMLVYACQNLNVPSES